MVNFSRAGAQTTPKYSEDSKVLGELTRICGKKRFWVVRVLLYEGLNINLWIILCKGTLEYLRVYCSQEVGDIFAKYKVTLMGYKGYPFGKFVLLV